MNNSCTPGRFHFNMHGAKIRLVLLLEPSHASSIRYALSDWWISCLAWLRFHIVSSPLSWCQMTLKRVSRCAQPKFTFSLRELTDSRKQIKYVLRLQQKALQKLSSPLPLPSNASLQASTGILTFEGELQEFFKMLGLCWKEFRRSQASFKPTP